MDPDVKYIFNTAKKHGLSADDLIQEAELVEEYGEYFHVSFMGFGENQLREAARILSEEAA